MKEVRTTKMVEVTEVKFVAEDGKEFTGPRARIPQNLLVNKKYNFFWR